MIQFKRNGQNLSKLSATDTEITNMARTYLVVLREVPTCLLVAAPNFCSVATASPRRLKIVKTDK